MRRRLPAFIFVALPTARSSGQMILAVGHDVPDRR
jgi:hypothetical protein